MNFLDGCSILSLISQEYEHWYSLLQTVVEICQKKRQCKFQVTAKELSGGAAVDDICPGSSKFVEVAYKCSPCE
ncbi:hypothetical protein J437_LFUL016585 [Ladona fulva]|uniref:Uncharacterized protein n=1 Tax=Ladona fulva TaxID=123851 RepID=A0A8K0KKN9_LADFU|nr:hypothetical protein J437_LFUL016585 [Ladona fulva]